MNDLAVPAIIVTLFAFAFAVRQTAAVDARLSYGNPTGQTVSVTPATG
jgi:hypothetical protein